MDIFESTNKELSSKVSDGLSEFISEKVEEELTKRKDTFMKGLNMCEEEYPTFNDTIHTKWIGRKLTNDLSLPRQPKTQRITVPTNVDEFILNTIKIHPQTVGGSQLDTIFITNKGHIYANRTQNNMSNITYLYNYVILGFVQPSNCRGVIHVEDTPTNNNGRAATYKEADKDDFKHKCRTDLLDSRKGIGCKFNTQLHSIHDRNKTRGIGQCHCGGCKCCPKFRVPHQNYEQHPKCPTMTLFDTVGWQEDCIERFINNNICPDCNSGQVLTDKLDPDINVDVLRNPPVFTNEYIELLTLMTKKELVIPIYQIQTIFAKYHPRASENYVIEEKIQALSDMEKAVDERVKLEKEALAIKSKEVTERLKSEKDALTIKSKKVHEQRLQNMVTQLILRKETQDIENKRKSIRGILAHTEKKCARQLQEINKQKNTLREESETLKVVFQDKCVKRDTEYNHIASKLLTIANELTMQNELQGDTSGKSDELFSIIDTLTNITPTETNNEAILF